MNIPLRWLINVEAVRRDEPERKARRRSNYIFLLVLVFANWLKFFSRRGKKASTILVILPIFDWMNQQKSVLRRLEKWFHDAEHNKEKCDYSSIDTLRNFDRSKGCGWGTKARRSALVYQASAKAFVKNRSQRATSEIYFQAKHQLKTAN